MGLWDVENYGPLADRASWALFGVTIFTVGLRIICRVYFVNGLGRLGGLGLDDYITMVCVIILLLSCILMSIGAHYGLGRRINSLEPANIEQALKWDIITNSILIWSFSLPKFAIIAILKRILNYGTKTKILFWSLAVSSQACIFATSVLWFKQCDPVEYGWNKNIKGTCAPVSVLANLGYFTSAYSAFLDIFFALYPIPFIMRLNMALKSRIAVSVALGLSSLACIVSIYKLAIFGKVFEISAVDPTYPVPYLDILGIAEGAILVICASLPTLGPLFRLTKETLTSRNGSKITPNQSGDSSQAYSDNVVDNSWAKLKGKKQEDPERVSTDIHASVDDIPLVSVSKTPQD